METIKRPGRPVGTVAPKSDAVKRVRNTLGLTQVEFAHQLNCSPSAIQKMERKGVLPLLGSLRDAFEKAAKRAGVSIETEVTA